MTLITLTALVHMVAAMEGAHVIFLLFFKEFRMIIAYHRQEIECGVLPRQISTQISCLDTVL